MFCAELPPTPALHTSHLLTVICSSLLTADLYMPSSLSVILIIQYLVNNIHCKITLKPLSHTVETNDHYQS